MKKAILLYFILLMIGGLNLLIPDISIGQTLAEEVFDKYHELFKKPNINRLLPDALRVFNKPSIRDYLYPLILEMFVHEPNYLSFVDPEFDDEFITLLLEDEDLQTLFYEEQFYEVLKNPTETEQLVELIENIQIPTTLEIVSGNQQIGKPNTPLSEPFVVVVKDQNGIPISGITVTFQITIGNGYLSNTTKTTNPLGQVQTTLTFGSTAGRTWITVGVDGILEKQVFTGTAIGDVIPTKTPTVIDTPKTTNLVVNFTLTTMVSPPTGAILPLFLNIEGGENITGYEFVIEYDPTALKYDITTNQDFNGDFLQNVYQNVYPLEESNQMKRLRFIAASSTSVSSGDGNLAVFTFEVLEVKMSTVTLIDVILLDNSDTLLMANVKNSQVLIQQYDTDVNNDGVVNELDLSYVSSNIGTHTLNSAADVNKDGVVNILDYKLVAEAISKIEEVLYIPEDVNEDGEVNILDIVSIVNKLGLTDDIDDVDVNGDGEVNVLDLVQVASKIGESTAAPSLHSLKHLNLSHADVQGWLTQARAFQTNDPAYQQGIAVLEGLLATIIQVQKEEAPQKTALLVNYPNPFNPETWIPYQLAEATDVTIVIHAMNGSLVRRLSLGHQAAGMYRSKNRAAYWDGRNALGESVASGLYFYTLTAGNYSATHKMLIRK